jgi:riboflavin kinase/FMN adenylyltransferase
VKSLSVVVIGNFDGVHLGHRAVLQQARAMADARKLRCVVLTFDPHPSEVLGRGAPPKLMAVARRVKWLRAAGADDVVVEPFTLEFAGWAPAKFARELLVDKLGARLVVVGRNFRFGSERLGDFSTLESLGAGLGFEAVAASVAGDAGGPFSSTRVRDAIAAGDVERAASVLGRCHSIAGVVVHGDARGRTIGFPTANLSSLDAMLPAAGVYAIRAEVSGEKNTRDGVMNIGFRPTVDGSSLRVEVHIFDFDRDLYGSLLRVQLVARIRDERKFAGIAELRAQIEADAAFAKQLLHVGALTVVNLGDIHNV